MVDSSVFSVAGAASTNATLSAGTIVLTLGVALIAAGATITVTALTLNARKKELRAEIATREKAEQSQREEREEQRRADAVEDIIAGIIDQVDIFKAEWLTLNEKGLVGPGKMVAVPSDTVFTRTLTKLVTRLHEPDLRDAALAMLDGARGSVPLRHMGIVYAILERRIVQWFLGAASTEETIATMLVDAELFSANTFPPGVVVPPAPWDLPGWNQDHPQESEDPDSQ